MMISLKVMISALNIVASLATRSLTSIEICLHQTDDQFLKKRREESLLQIHDIVKFLKPHNKSLPIPDQNSFIQPGHFQIVVTRIPMHTPTAGSTDLVNNKTAHKHCKLLVEEMDSWDYDVKALLNFHTQS